MAVMVLVGACSAAPASPTAPVAGGTPAPTLQGCSQTSVGLTPLSYLTSGDYQGTPGGLYPNRQNEVPSAHLAAGVALARAVGPRDANGQPSAMGRYAFVSIGMSNTTQEFSAFVPIAANDPAKDPSLVVIDGAQGGQTAADWANPGCACWTALDNRLRQAGVSAAQVATAWLKLANRQPSEGWPTHAQQLTNDTIRVLELLRTRFPGLTLAYLSSRIYAGYATTTLNPEPYAYQSGFSVRWAIERQLAGGLPYEGSTAAAPWLAWGPYLWADGLVPRSDGLTWACHDLQADGTHPSASGRQQVASRLHAFVRTDPTAREWYLR
jgi:hypothetical protein